MASTRLDRGVCRLEVGATHSFFPSLNAGLTDTPLDDFYDWSAQVSPEAPSILLDPGPGFERNNLVGPLALLANRVTTTCE